MGDKKPPESNIIPSWQRLESSPIPNVQQQDSRETSSPNPPGSRDSLISQASSFLLNEKIRDAPSESKKTFLQTKGLSNDEVDTLLRASESKKSSSAQTEVESRIPESVLIASSQKEGDQDTEQQSSDNPSATPRDIAPIITYPEFLLHIQKPPPLFTTQRILKSLYASFGAGATVYGMSKFIVSPMIEALDSARHSLLESTSTNLDLMNEKLEQAVSEIPAEFKNDGNKFPSRRGSATDLDPAELFHRSIATQTSPGTSPLNSPKTSHTAGDTSSRTDQNTCLHILHDQLGGLLVSDATPDDSSKSVQSRLNQFQHYLDSLAYGNFVVPNSHLKPSQADEISKMKAEIRGFKGALLSARSFPSGAGYRGRGSG